jgi:H+/Cl- antiporter ClcA
MSGLFLLSGSNSNLIILCGMVGILMGVTKRPFILATLVLEMTDQHNVIFHLILVAMGANII